MASPVLPSLRYGGGKRILFSAGDVNSVSADLNDPPKMVHRSTFRRKMMIEETITRINEYLTKELWMDFELFETESIDVALSGKIYDCGDEKYDFLVLLHIAY